MKKIIFSITCMFIGLAFVSGQCTKSAASGCCKSKKTAEATTTDNSTVAQLSEADIAAAADQSIQKRQCAESGTISYFQKSVDNEGKTVWNEVKFDESTKKFKQVASVMMEKTVEGPKEVNKKEGCSKSAAKGCCASKKQSSL